MFLHQHAACHLNLRERYTLQKANHLPLQLAVMWGGKRQLYLNFPSLRLTQSCCGFGGYIHASFIASQLAHFLLYTRCTERSRM